MTSLSDSDMYKKSKASLPEGRFSYSSNMVEYIPMRDGTKLATSIYRPDRGKSWPVLFTRNPYPHNKELLEAVYMPLVEHGYCLVIQDCRGTGDSEGEWEPFINERNDGIDSLRWLTEQEWMNGNIGTFGRSYSGFTQWIVADCLPKEVKTMAIEVFGVDRHSQVYMDGMFREDIYTSWAFANSGVESELSPAELYRKALQIQPADQRDEQLLGVKLPFYQHYLKESSNESSYWKDSIWQILKEMPRKIDIPILITGGWADHHLDGTIYAYESLLPAIKAKSKLIVGPWDHIGNTTGNLDYPFYDKFGFMNISALHEWFDNQMHEEKRLQESEVYVIGKRQWEKVENWPPKCDQTQLYLNCDYKLTNHPKGEGSLSYEYNPSNPVTTNGGSALLAWISPGFTDIPHGFITQEDYKDREDVLTFKTDPLNGSMKIMGKIIAKLLVSSSAEDTAFTIKVCEEFKNGETYNVADGITSIGYRNNSSRKLNYDRDEMLELEIKTWDIAWQFQEGSRIRIDISSSNYPMYHIHSNTNKPWAAVGKSGVIAKQFLHFGENGCRVMIPTVKEI
ncbi:CocE/NonD family hydrolase [Terribacillus saccharophilus]|uniref:CocE/NonD family hydrolase n=1 Tax=Terribacillus saccharophilus TaxID=361277 RepID=UPI003981AD67